MEAETLAAAQEIDFSMWALFAQSTFVVKLTMLILILASFWAWSIIIQKHITYRRARREADLFDQRFWSGEPLDGLFDEVEFPDDLFLGHADRFVIHEEEDMVSLPEEREEIVNPVEVKRFDEGACRMYFANDGDPFGLLENPEEVTLGLGFFPWLTIQSKYWDKPRVGGMG